MISGEIPNLPRGDSMLWCSSLLQSLHSKEVFSFLDDKTQDNPETQGLFSHWLWDWMNEFCWWGRCFKLNQITGWHHATIPHLWPVQKSTSVWKIRSWYLTTLCQWVNHSCCYTEGQTRAEEGRAWQCLSSWWQSFFTKSLVSSPVTSTPLLVTHNFLSLWYFYILISQETSLLQDFLVLLCTIRFVEENRILSVKFVAVTCPK